MKTSANADKSRFSGNECIRNLIYAVLDVSIGTGNQTLPLAEMGIALYGSDLSEEMLKKCRIKANNEELMVNLRKCDFRQLRNSFDQSFDCVISTGNSLPHVTKDEIENVLEQMDLLVYKGGYIYFDMRNWDKILKESNRFYLYNPVFIDGLRINNVQVWDYNLDETMTFNILYSYEKDNEIIRKEVFEETYYPVKQEFLINKLKRLGYKDIQVMCHPAFVKDIDVNKADWYCMIARKNYSQDA